MNSTDALVSPVTYMWTLWMRAKKYFKSWTTAITNVQYIPPNSSVPPPPPTFFRDAKSTQAMPSVFFRIFFCANSSRIELVAPLALVESDIRRFHSQGVSVPKMVHLLKKHYDTDVYGIG